ncbi:MAG: glycoside hydrolase family 15 protein [Polyangiaceae bacterium]|nr:glycoside hydrolase family 15 protein [Polyangiaceae bacterium]
MSRRNTTALASLQGRRFMDSFDYGIIGNGRSCALVSARGSIDWCCLADFDSPSVFAALLDQSRGGQFAIEPVDVDFKTDQRYLRHTNVLVTRFVSSSGAFDVTDFMPRYHTSRGSHHCPPEVVRLVRPVVANPMIRIRFEPRLGYAEHPTRITRFARYLKAETTVGAHESVYLYSNLDLGAVQAGEPLRLQGDSYLLLAYDQKIGRVDLERVVLAFERTKLYWMNWCVRAARTPVYREHVERSALVLKLLSYQPTGAILAAATTSLPEQIGKERNWDYRFCWIRDASMTIRTLVNLGHRRVARRFFEFLLDAVPYKDDRIQVMYGIRGQKELTERTLDWLSGYADSRPVRIGNAAWCQQQHDIYGVLLDAIHAGLVMFRGEVASLEALWTMTRGIVRHIEAHWKEPDQGIWEIRGAPRHFTFSKVMCWVGLERAARIAALLGMDEYCQPWTTLAERIRSDVFAHGYDAQVGAFTQSYGSPYLDATNLLLCRLGFIGADDPRWAATVHATRRELCREGLMYRYRHADDFGVPESAFLVCTFWMVQALLSIGERRAARESFEEVLGCGNHLGLLSEDVEFATKRLLGNFPQAYSHLALIDTALLFAGGPLRTETLLRECEPFDFTEDD